MLNEFAKVYLATLSGKDPSIRAAALKSYLDQAQEDDKRMAIHLLNGYKSIVQVKRTDLTQWLLEYKDLPDWLIKESHTVTRDWAETFALIVGNPDIRTSGLTLHELVSQLSEPKTLKKELRHWVESMWSTLSPEELLLFHKLILGSFKAIKEKNFLAVFLTAYYQADLPLITLRLNRPTDRRESFSSLIDPDWDTSELAAKPYTFNQPQLHKPELQVLGTAGEWYGEPFLSGQRVQLIHRNQDFYVWTPDLILLASPPLPLIRWLQSLPAGIVLDGVIQRYIDPSVSETGLSKSHHEDRFIALDILEWEFMDLRDTPLLLRKQLLRKIGLEIKEPSISLVFHQDIEEWDHIKPDFYPDGWVLKRKDGLYHPEVNRWWRFKSLKKQLYTILMYTEALPRQNHTYLCTFGIYNDKQELIPIIKLSSDQLGEAQMTQLHYWIQNNVIQKFGPVRVVRPQQVFLVDFDKSIKNQRLKSGYTLKNAQIKKWETKPGPVHKIGLLETLKDQN
ncbi:MAG: hypothetical protein SH818_13310 [Saprospiraceae bacterium]|nr:hypothetical protein [Saprospiraceae bacterium]